MNADFATAVKEALTHPRCCGLMFWPERKNKWCVSMFMDDRNTMFFHIDANPMAALYKCLVEFERRAKT